MPDTLRTPRPPHPTAAVPRFEVDGTEAELFLYGDDFQRVLRGLSHEACIVIARRAAARGDVSVRLQRAFTEAQAAGFDYPRSYAAGGSHAVLAAGFSYDTAADTFNYHLAAANAAEAAAANAGEASNDARVDVWKAISLDYWRLKKLTATPDAVPLTGWDDPRLGPLWPDGEPEWHQRAEARLRELTDKLANRPDPFAPPVPAEKLAHFADSKFLNDKLRTGELAAFGGNYVLAYAKQIVGHGPELGAVREQKAAELGVPEHRFAVLFVHA